MTDRIALWRLLMIATACFPLLAADLAGATIAPEQPPAVSNAVAVDLPGLPHVFHLSKKLYTGAAPEGDEGFRTLRRLGIRTILTVDGAEPDVKRAHRFGLRYVHLPFGYDGCPVPQANRIVRAVRDLPGPVYLHCHHGKHRAPTAAAYVRVALDGLSPQQAVREMERAGTGKEYTGLYGGVLRYRPPAPAELRRLPARFPEVSPAPPLVESMVQVDERFTRLQQARKADWNVPAGAGERPAHDALLLRELFTEAGRTAEARRRPEELRRWLERSARDAGELEASLGNGTLSAAGEAFDRLAAGCSSCHARYRNVPQERGAGAK